MAIAIYKILEPERYFGTTIPKTLGIVLFWRVHVLAVGAVLALNNEAISTDTILHRSIQSLLNEFWTTELVEEPEGVGLGVREDRDAEPGVLDGVDVEDFAVAVLRSDFQCIFLSFANGLCSKEIVTKIYPVAL